jgi:hypothetical protein
MSRFRSSLTALFGFLLAGCGAPPPAESSADAPDAAPPRHTTSPSVQPTAAALPPPSSSPTPRSGGEHVETDVAVMVGGRFVSDHIGPEEYDRVSARFDGNTDAYVAEALRLAQRSTHRQLSSFQFPHFLQRASARAPHAARAAANAMLPLYVRALDEANQAPSDDFEVRRLHDRLAHLHQVIKIVDAQHGAVP